MSTSPAMRLASAGRLAQEPAQEQQRDPPAHAGADDDLGPARQRGETPPRPRRAIGRWCRPRSGRSIRRGRSSRSACSRSPWRARTPPAPSPWCSPCRTCSPTARTGSPGLAAEDRRDRRCAAALRRRRRARIAVRCRTHSKQLLAPPETASWPKSARPYCRSSPSSIPEGPSFRPSRSPRRSSARAAAPSS